MFLKRKKGKKIGNANISQAMAANKLSLVSFESALKVAYVSKCMISKMLYEQHFWKYSDFKVILAVGRARYYFMQTWFILERIG